MLWLCYVCFDNSYGTLHGHQDISSEKTSDSLNTPMSMKASVYGVTLLLLSISMTSFAAVFTEKTLKQDISVSYYRWCEIREGVLNYCVTMGRKIFGRTYDRK